MTQPVNPITPIIDPILSLLRSRAVLYSLLNIIIYVLASNYGATPEFLELIKQLGLAVIIKMGAEDVAAKWGSNRPAEINAGTIEKLNTNTTPPNQRGTYDDTPGL